LAETGGEELVSTIEDYVFDLQQALTAMFNWYTTAQQISALQLEQTRLDDFKTHLEEVF
jgi:hypothetical protein